MTTFVFDADGVVCIGGSFAGGLAREHGITAEQMQSFFRGVFRECITGPRDLKQELPPWLGAWGWTGSIDAFLAFWFQTEHVLCPAVLSTVHDLREQGHRCVLATNQEHHRTAYLRSQMGLAQRFDAVFASCEIGYAKPSPDFFDRLHAQLGGSTDDLLLVDDTPANVAGARQAGWRAHHYTGTDDLPAIRAHAHPG